MKVRISRPKARPASAAELLLRRVVVENVNPGGVFAVKRTPGQKVEISADILADGHDQIVAVLRYHHVLEREWHEIFLEPLGNDSWTAEFEVNELGTYEYLIEAWIDPFASWLSDAKKKFEAKQDMHLEIAEGMELLEQAASRARFENQQWLRDQAKRLKKSGDPLSLDNSIIEKIAVDVDRSLATVSGTYKILVERERARYGAWYEIFPRSASAVPGAHGTLRDCEKRLPYVHSMGFDVLYLAPIHPIGTSYRKGPNNSLNPTPDDPGSPWAIGSHEGGHKSVHPELGTIQDFDRLVQAAKKFDIEIALDLAFQCSPDHPYVHEHPEWFRHRSDGSIRYAENPPKKYQDIYPFCFDCDDWESLWEELKSIVLFWARHNVRIFRVDNPHTKPFRFWSWLMEEVRQEYPDVIFLSEAFTRPKIMYHLAQLGFSQSYTYFTWRNTKSELVEYFTELSELPVRDYFRGNLFVNTPDILHEFLQAGGKAAFQLRLVLAATLGASYGIYGPPYELLENRSIPGTEEYQDSEKYQIRFWDLKRQDSLKDFITRVNQIRRENRALHHDWRLKFHPVTNEQLICYSKSTEDLSNTIVVVVNLDPHHPQEGVVALPISELGLETNRPFQVHDLITDARYFWQGESNFVRLEPSISPAHIFRLRRKIKTERDFDYFL